MKETIFKMHCQPTSLNLSNKIKLKKEQNLFKRNLSKFWFQASKILGAQKITMKGQELIKYFKSKWKI